MKKITLAFLFLLLSKNFLSAQGSCASPDGSFFGFDGGLSHTYATANANGWCYNNLNPGQTYCWTYFYPSGGSFTMDIILNQTCGNCEDSGLLLFTACSGGCSSVGVGGGCGSIQYNSSCAVQEAGGFEHGDASCSPAEVCGTNFTWCITVPAGCSTMDVCPMVNCSAGPGNCVGIMPILLLYLDGKFENGKPTIKWTTAAETNNDYFTIERAIVHDASGKSNLQFFPVGMEKGSGNSSTAIPYEFTDNSLDAERFDENDGFIYYRIKQTDFDGKFVYYGPISVKIENENNISVLPSFSSGLFNVLLSKSANSIIIYDSMGKVIQVNALTENQLSKTIDLTEHPNGMYFIKIISGDRAEMQKILVNK